jgi:hypothetical protein
MSTKPDRGGQGGELIAEVGGLPADQHGGDHGERGTYRGLQQHGVQSVPDVSGVVWLVDPGCSALRVVGWHDHEDFRPVLRWPGLVAQFLHDPQLFEVVDAAWTVRVAEVDDALKRFGGGVQVCGVGEQLPPPEPELPAHEVRSQQYTGLGRVGGEAVLDERCGLLYVRGGGRVVGLAGAVPGLVGVGQVEQPGRVAGERQASDLDDPVVGPAPGHRRGRGAARVRGRTLRGRRRRGTTSRARRRSARRWRLRRRSRVARRHACAVAANPGSSPR